MPREPYPKDLGDPSGQLDEEQFGRLHRFNADQFFRMGEDQLLGNWLRELLDGHPAGDQGAIRRWWPDEVARMAELGIVDPGRVEHLPNGFLLDRG